MMVGMPEFYSLPPIPQYRIHCTVSVKHNQDICIYYACSKSERLRAFPGALLFLRVALYRCHVIKKESAGAFAMQQQRLMHHSSEGNAMACSKPLSDDPWYQDE